MLGYGAIYNLSVKNHHCKSTGSATYNNYLSSLFLYGFYPHTIDKFKTNPGNTSSPDKLLGESITSTPCP